LRELPAWSDYFKSEHSFSITQSIHYLDIRRIRRDSFSNCWHMPQFFKKPKNVFCASRRSLRDKGELKIGDSQ
jgi:hypothetical protein